MAAKKGKKQARRSAIQLLVERELDLARAIGASANPRAIALGDPAVVSHLELRLTAGWRLHGSSVTPHENGAEVRFQFLPPSTGHWVLPRDFSAFIKAGDGRVSGIDSSEEEALEEDAGLVDVPEKSTALAHATVMSGAVSLTCRKVRRNGRWVWECD